MHLDGLGHLSYLQVQIDAHDLIDVKMNVRTFGDTEALLLRTHGVHPDGQKRKHIVAAIARCGLASQAGELTAHSDLDQGHHSSARVFHGASDLAGGRLACAGAWHAKEQGEQGG